MKAMIFAAGLGTRLKPLTDTMPKALVPLAGKPLLQWQVEKLREAGITDIIVNVHHFPDQIIEAVRANHGWGCNITVSDERDQLLDTGGGLKKAISNLQSPISNSPILACNVDILSNIDLRAFLGSYDPRTLGSLVVSDRPTQRYLCFDASDRLCGWTNIATGEVKGRDGRHLAFSGMQILSPEALTMLQQYPAAKFSLIDFYLSLCEKQMSNDHTASADRKKCQMTNLQAYIPDTYKMMDVGKIDQIAEAERFAESL